MKIAKSLFRTPVETKLPHEQLIDHLRDRVAALEAENKRLAGEVLKLKALSQSYTEQNYD